MNTKLKQTSDIVNFLPVKAGQGLDNIVGAEESVPKMATKVGGYIAANIAQAVAAYAAIETVTTSSYLGSIASTAVLLGAPILHLVYGSGKPEN